MAAFDVVKCGSTDDDESRVATWWRPSEPCTGRAFTAACWAGGSGHLAELQAAWDTLELRVERRCDVAKDSMRAGAVGIVAEPGIGSQGACMHPRTSSGVLGYSIKLYGPPWVVKGACVGSWVNRTIRYRRQGGSYIGRVTITYHQQLFSCVFCGVPTPMDCPMTSRHSKQCVICEKKRLDETNPLNNKRDPIIETGHQCG